MELESLRVQNYRCIDDSGWVSVDELTCFVGKNESGKTAFMRAVEKINPSYRTDEYTPYEDYPRGEWPEYTERHDDDPDVVASARLRLEEADRDAVAEAYAPGLIADPVVTVHKDYQNELSWEIDVDGRSAIDYLLDEHEFSPDVRAELRETDSLSALGQEAASELEAETGGTTEETLAAEVGDDLLTDRLPAFRYVGEYSVMDGTVELDQLLEDYESGAVAPGDRGFLSLLSVAGIDPDEFREVEDWREKTAELEAGSASVSDEAMQYWSQSGDLRIRVQPATVGEDDRRVLDLRVEDREHDITIEFGKRSHGFRRFFSTFCQLAELRDRDEEIVLMLDEPGLNLHARAKQEFLEFLKSELASRHPLIYSTHSPFMIDPETLHRVQMVSPDPVGETNVFSEVSLADEYTRFPLRNVFELDLMDTLLVRPQVLLVERKADHVYLYVLSKILQDAGDPGLDNRWTVVPVKDADNIDSFVSLFGEETLDAAALLVDEPDRPAGRGSQSEGRSVPTVTVSEYSSSRGRSTIEDLLAEPFYLQLVSRTYATELDRATGVPSRLSVEDLSETDPDAPIVERLRTYFERNEINDGEFDRTEPALYLQNERLTLAEEIDQESRRNFSQLFTELNNILESFDSIETESGGLFGGLFG